MRGNGYTFGFAAAICVVCSLLLSGVSGALKERQEKNRVVDRQKNILMALGYEKEALSKMNPDEVGQVYLKDIEEAVINNSGATVPGKPMFQVASGRQVSGRSGCPVRAGISALP